MMERNRGIEGRAKEELRTEVRAKWLYGQWLAKEANGFHISVIEARPWISLDERILAATIIEWREDA